MYGLYLQSLSHTLKKRKEDAYPFQNKNVRCLPLEVEYMPDILQSKRMSEGQEFICT